MSLNRVTLLGNVGKDPDVRYLDTGVCVAQFSLATTERGYTKEDGTQVPDRTEWHDIVAWRGIAQTIEKYVKKGDKLYVEGKLRGSSYEDQNGVKHYRKDVYVDNMEMLTPKQGGKPLPPDLGAPQQPQAPTASAATKTPAQPIQQQVDFSGDDDMPF